MANTSIGDSAEMDAGQVDFNQVGIPDITIQKLAEDLGNNSKLQKLGLILSLKRSDVIRFMQTNRAGGSVGTEGTSQMLFSWKEDTPMTKQIPTLRRALEEAKLAEYADKYFSNEVAFSGPEARQPIILTASTSLPTTGKSSNPSHSAGGVEITRMDASICEVDKKTIELKDDSDNDGEVDLVPTLLELRDYQEEVAGPALRGENSMVVLPTGTGKTEVAIAVIKRRFLQPVPVTGATSSDYHRRKKVVFVVNKVPLVKQQKDRCLKYLKGSCKVAGVSGKGLDRVPLETVIECHDITVLTAQVLVNALVDKGSRLQLSDIALLVLDECHHCRKMDPYNALMAMYRDLKLNTPKERRPQILALTASPGVGDSKNKTQVKDYLIKLCANLDCRLTRPYLYKSSSKKRSNAPKEFQTILKGRSMTDPYFMKINEMMKSIEQMIIDNEEGRKLMEVEEFVKLASCRGQQSYEQAVVKLKKLIQTEIEGDNLQELFTCVNYLREYNNSLNVNRDARTTDAIAHMVDYIEEQSRSNPSGKTDTQLQEMFNDKLPDLTMISQKLASANPVLNELGRQLMLEYTQNPDSLSIIFIKTKATVHALKKWLNEDQELKELNLNAGILTGTGTEGMTSADQATCIEKFRDKKHKVILATSVAEEGLDISDCNLIFRYNYVTSDIGHEQTKGRSRAFNGKVFVIINSDLQLESRELRNRIRVKMKEETVKAITEISPKKFQQLILDEQKKDQKMRRMDMERKTKQKVGKVRGSNVSLHCTKCSEHACDLDDIKAICTQHHVVCSDKFLGRIRRVAQKKQPVIDNMKLKEKIHCAKCQQKWGSIMVYKGEELPMIAVKNFTLKVGQGQKLLPKQWKEVPFVIQEIGLDDLVKPMNAPVKSQDREVVEEEGNKGTEDEDSDENNEALEYDIIMQVDD